MLGDGLPRECRSMRRMIPLLSGQTDRFAAHVAGALMICALAACGPPPPATTEIPDPFEGINRGLYQINVGFDKTVLKPISETMGATGREGIFGALNNFAENMDMPSNILNDLMQGKITTAATDTLRFGVNTVFGLAGILNPADEMGIPYRDTDFGETMFTWGVDEGAYVVLPFYGPSSTRDATGLLIDDAMNPLRLVVSTPLLWAGTWSKLAGQFGTRVRYSETVDSLLYDSADGYAQARLLYQQYRQFELGQAPAESSFVDPYEDPYGQ